jgi:hypothetical protein
MSPFHIALALPPACLALAFVVIFFIAIVMLLSLSCFRHAAFAVPMLLSLA